MLLRNTLLKAVAVGAVVFGAAQADIVQTLHNTTAWQSLGEETVGPNYSDRYSLNGRTTTNNGVFWTDASGDGIITVGEEVTFDLILYKEYMGTHNYDALMVWIDDVEVYRAVQKLTGHNDNLVQSTNHYGFSYTFDEVGEYDLLARATCSETLRSKFGATDAYNADPYLITNLNRWSLDPHRGGFNQGEAEMYKLSVVNNVPEPTMVSLLGFGLLGLGFVRRRNKK